MTLAHIDGITIIRKAAGSDIQLDTSYSGGHLWVRVQREHNGRPMSFSKPLATDYNETDLHKIADEIKQWWDEVRE